MMAQSKINSDSRNVVNGFQRSLSVKMNFWDDEQEIPKDILVDQLEEIFEEKEENNKSLDTQLVTNIILNRNSHFSDTHFNTFLIKYNYIN